MPSLIRTRAKNNPRLMNYDSQVLTSNGVVTLCASDRRLRSQAGDEPKMAKKKKKVERKEEKKKAHVGEIEYFSQKQTSQFPWAVKYALNGNGKRAPVLMFIKIGKRRFS